MLGGLGEAEPRVDDDAVGGHPRAERVVDALGQFGPDVGDHVAVDGQLAHGTRVPAPVHEHPRAAGVTHDPGHVRVGQPAGDVVDHRRTGGQGRLGDPGPGRVDADRHARGGQLADDREHPADLGVGVHPVRARPGGLASHVDELRAVVAQTDAVSDGGVEVGVPSAVGEGVGRDVEDAHHHRGRGPYQIGHD